MPRSRAPAATYKTMWSEFQTWVNQHSCRMPAGQVLQVTDRVTRNKQWVRINPEIQLLDTPGILWPKFEDANIGLNLAFTGAIKDEIMDSAELAARLMERLAVIYPQNLIERYKLSDIEGRTGLELLEEAGRNRGCLISGGRSILQDCSNRTGRVQGR